MSGVPGPVDLNRDSSLSLSPVPSPHTQSYHDNIIVNPQAPGISKDGVLPAPLIPNAKNTTAPAPEKVKRPRKKKEPTTADPSNEPPKEKKPRKPRASNPEGTAASRKKAKLSDAATPAASPAAQPNAARQPVISELLARPPNQPPPPKSNLASLMAPVVKPESALSPSVVSATAPIRPPSSGQRYDPIRGFTMDAPPPRQPPPPAQPAFTNASPSLASLMNPSRVPPQPQQQPQPPSYSTPASSQSPFPVGQTQPPSSALPPSNIGSSPIKPETPSNGSKSVPAQPAKQTTEFTPMDVDSIPHPALKAHQLKVSEDKPASKPSSAAATPKEKRTTPPRPSGSGLLSSSDLFGGAGALEDGKARKGVDINITIQLNPNGGNTINIAQEIMKKYGRDAINPRAAAHRERLLQVAAAANRLGEGSGDDMSVDGSDGADDSNIEMGGMGDGGSTAGEGPDGSKTIKRRRRKAEDYDKEDDFIDDTELAWQESAAVAKDGFFVYSGPLVRKEEKAAIEKATTATRGRGRGRGRGARGAATGATHASVAAKAADASGASPTSSATRGARARARTGTTAAPRKPKPKAQSSQPEKDPMVVQPIPQPEIMNKVPVA